MRVFVIFGPPGAGKGTQGEALGKKNLVKHLSTGEVLRNNIQEKTEIGLKAKSFIDQGKLVPDSILDPMIKNYIDQYESNLPLMLDGYPRTIDQAKYLVSLLDSKKSLPIVVINFALPDAVLQDRLLKRGRADDTADTIKVRLDVYKTQTQPIINYFKELSASNQAILHNVNGDQNVDHVMTTVEKIVNSL